jgi:Centromere DNA-binding protein complex CBF3 subunit, domain 2
MQSPLKEFGYSKQYKHIAAALDELGLSTTVKTQQGRKSGSANAENNGASGDSVDRLGLWATGARAGAYINNVVPWEAVRIQAGCRKEPKSYYVKRATIDPPLTLQIQIFPNVESSEEIVKNLLANKVVGSRDTEISGISFLRLMKRLRTFILQDAAILMDMVYCF